MKKHTLNEHVENAELWWFAHRNTQTQREGELMFLLAYERWLNDRPLLTDEDDADSVRTPVA